MIVIDANSNPNNQLNTLHISIVMIIFLKII